MERKKYNIMEVLDKLIDYRGKTPKKSATGRATLSAKSVKMGYIDYDSCYYISEDEYNKFMVRGMPQVGDVLLTTEAPLGNVSQLDRDDVAVAQRLLLLRGKKDLIDNAFLSYYLQSSEGQQLLKAKQSGSTVKGFRQEEFRKIEVNIPDLKTQKKISEILLYLDKKILKTKEINQTLKLLVKQVFDYWFIQYDFPVAEGSFKKNNGIFEWNESLRRNTPKDWRTVSIKDILLPIERGISYTSDNISEKTTDMPMINLACFDKHGNYRSGQLKYFSGTFSDNSIIKPYDILIACTDLTQKADIIGSPIFVPSESDSYLYTMDLAKITPIDEKLKYYLYFYLKHESFHNYIKPFASGTNVKHLDLRGLLRYPIVIPNDEILLAFNKVISPIIISLNENEKEISETINFRKFIFPLLMNGQIEI